MEHGSSRSETKFRIFRVRGKGFFEPVYGLTKNERYASTWGDTTFMQCILSQHVHPPLYTLRITSGYGCQQMNSHLARRKNLINIGQLGTCL
eukprot:scaffold302404_cov47-Prasinocladus_malaysianus.AAC.1